MSPENTRPLLPPPFERPRLRFMTCGSVDDGKSTLIGRLLLDSGAVYEDHLDEAGKAGGETLDLSFLVDGLKAEREQGITIDVAYRYFATPRRAFLIADAPGHEQYTRNQAAAASQTDLAVLLVSAVDGVQPQTRRHLAIAAMFGISDVVIAVNKMDRAGYREAAFTPLAETLRHFAAGLGLNVVAAVPLSAREGDNVVHPGAAMGWYAGPTLLRVLEDFEAAQRTAAGTILPVALTGRFDGGGRVSFGEVAAGTLRVGQDLQSDMGESATVAGLWAAGVEVEAAPVGTPVAVALTPERDIGRGSVLSHGIRVPLATQLRARLVWLAAAPARPGGTYDLQIGHGQSVATLTRLEGRLDIETMAVEPTDAALGANDIAIVRLNLGKPLPVLPFDDSRALGALILVDRLTRRTVAAGIVLSVERRRDDTPWHALEIAPANRARLMHQTPAVIWMTGLSGAGKSTIAALLDRRLHALGRHATVLDGDNLRHGLNADLGFSDADRAENVRRVGAVAALMADAGLIVIVSLISPFRESRARAREAIGPGRFFEVFVDAPFEVCQQRDPKGFYARATSGDMARFTGVGSAYEPPEEPDLHLRTDLISPEAAVRQILDALRARRHADDDVQDDIGL